MARMSQSELGERLGVSFQQVQKYVVKLLTSYADISDQAIRRCLAELVDQISLALKNNERR